MPKLLVLTYFDSGATGMWIKQIEYSKYALILSSSQATDDELLTSFLAACT